MRSPVSTMAVGGGDLDLDLPDKIHEELLICKICYGKFTTKPESLPKLLVCSHTFCAECIKEYLSKRKKKNKFPCPLCRRETYLPKEGIKSLTSNYTILGLIDLLEREQKTENENRDAHRHGKRSSQTVHFTSAKQFGNAVARQNAKQKKWNTAKSQRAQPGFADLGPQCVSPVREKRPPPLNPQFSDLSLDSPGTSTMSTSSSSTDPKQKPELPVRIPGAPSSISHKSGKQIGKMISMARPQSMISFPCAPDDPYAEVTSVLSETISTGSGSMPSSPIRLLRPPQPPPRRVSSESVAATPIRCLKKIGHFSEDRMQTNAFTQPTRVSISEVTGDIIVIDSIQMILQVFDCRGDYISMFKVLGLQSACFMSTDKIAATTHRGVEIYKPNGQKIKELVVGNSVSTIPYKFGFIIAKPRSLSFFSNGLIQYKDLLKVKIGKLRSISFKCIQDIVVNSLKDLIVLDVGRGEIYILDSDGNLKININPSKETCGAFKQAEGITTDQWNNILVSDTGNSRVLKFSANGTYARCLLNFRLWSNQDTGLQTHGVTVTPARDKMAVVITGNKIAYIAIYQLH